MKSDNSFLVSSPFEKFFNFSTKSDPFLVFPSTKQSHGVPGAAGQARTLRNLRGGHQQKTLIPLANAHMKLIRQSEVYLMEEAVTDQIVRSAASMFENEKENINIYKKENSEEGAGHNDSGIVNVETFVK